MSHVELVFWAAIAVAGYAYLGYPALLLALVRLRPAPPVAKAPITPSVSFIISAHNEERRICAKIENTLRCDYPSESFEILVASDGSSDRTDALVSEYASYGVRLVRTGTRQGKEAAQKLAVEAARGEIVVFSDAGTELAPDGVRKIVMSFADPTVGCVSSVDALIDADGNLSGEGAYVRYEMLLRRLESALGSVVGLSGSFFAVRRSACREWAIDVQSDFNTLLNCVRMGLRGVSDEESVGYYRGRREGDSGVRAEGPDGPSRHHDLDAPGNAARPPALRPVRLATRQPQALSLAGPFCHAGRARREPRAPSV